jgi:predicted type IV restriction endonuclease
MGIPAKTSARIVAGIKRFQPILASAKSLAFLVEVKAVGLALKDNFVKQAIDYAANQGADWVVLTNGVIWRIYKVSFAKPIAHELVVEFNLLEANPKSDENIETAFLLSKEGWKRSRLGEFQRF